MLVRELRRVMFVDDQTDMHLLANFALVDVGGLEVEICASGDEALEKVGSFRPDLILLDVHMPGMDGFATLNALRARPDTASTMVIFLTGDYLETASQQSPGDNLRGSGGKTIRSDEAGSRAAVDLEIGEKCRLTTDRRGTRIAAGTAAPQHRPAAVLVVARASTPALTGLSQRYRN